MTVLPDGMMVSNRTTHAINLFDPVHGSIVIPTDGEPVRVKVWYDSISKYLTRVQFVRGECNLPRQEPGLYLIVSSTVKRTFPERQDLIVPINMVREGRVVTACQAFGL